MSNTNTADTVCEPSEESTETIHHDAVGDPTVLVANPDYVAATPGTTAPTGNVVKWTWTGGPTVYQPESPLVDPTGWHRVGVTHDSKGNTVDVVNPGNGNGWFFYETEYVTIPGTPAIGDELIAGPNPDYLPAWDETVTTPAVVCDTTAPPVTTTPTIDEQAAQCDGPWYQLWGTVTCVTDLPATCAEANDLILATGVCDLPPQEPNILPINPNYPCGEYGCPPNYDMVFPHQTTTEPTPITTTTQPTTTQPTTTPNELAETGTIDPTTLLILGTAALAAGVVLMWRERVMRRRSRGVRSE